jgi:hypothetical protein
MSSLLLNLHTLLLNFLKHVKRKSADNEIPSVGKRRGNAVVLIYPREIRHHKQNYMWKETLNIKSICLAH